MTYESDNPQFDHLINNLNSDEVPYRRPSKEASVPTLLPTIANRRVAEAMGDYRNVEAAPEGVNPALDDLAEAVCGLGGHIPPRDRWLSPCDFHRRQAAGYLRVVEAS